MLKAMAGGQVSLVNGVEYKGGEFMPEHGEFCGRGKNRVSAAKLAEINLGMNGRRIVWEEERKIFKLLVEVTLSSGLKVEQTLCSARNIKTLVTA